MDFVYFCIWFFIAIAIFVASMVLTSLFKFTNDDPMLGIIVSWILLTVGFSVTLTYILFEKGFIR